jgi:hypothetical protein
MTFPGRALPFLAFILLLLLSGPLSLCDQPSAAFRISGIVIDSVTGAPVRNCHLDAGLTRAFRGPVGQGRRQSAAAGSAETDPQGHFAIVLPSAGTWHLTASAPGYVTEAYDAHGVYSSAVVLTPGAPSFDLTFHLPPQGRISGTILDEASEGVRNATVELIAQPLPSPGGRQAGGPVSRRITQTDDRGAYEFAGLLPGNYRLSVQTRPWYATAQRNFGLSQLRGTDSPTPQEPDLDVAYPVTWFPGVSDEQQAQLITLRPGDQQQADLQLVPIPSVHLKLIVPPVSDQRPGQPTGAAFPILERISTSGDAGSRFVQPTSVTNSQGQIDIGGLTPGTYRVRLQMPGQGANDGVVQLSEGSSVVVDLREAGVGMTNVSVKLDDEEDERSLSIELVDSSTGQRYRAGGNFASNLRGGPGNAQRQMGDSSLHVPSGRYEVVVTGREKYLTGISAQGAQVAGRFLTVHGGEVTLQLHTATGRASIRGVAALAGKPCIGAIVLLVPAGLDDPGSFTTVARDQSDTDGSFNLENVIPGQYILIAVDRGWDINWNDPTTLRRYLTQGVPLDLHSDATVKQNLNAQSP